MKKDKPQLEEECNLLYTRSEFYAGSCFEKRKLWTFGFIRALLEQSRLEKYQHAKRMIRFEERITLHVDKCDLGSVRAVVKEMREEEKKGETKLPFFILDEMAIDTSEERNVAAFQQNVFRACDLVVILMDTDATISDLYQRPRSGSCVDSIPWMAIVPRFPSYQLVLLSDSDRLVWSKAVERYPIVQNVVMHSRGRFSRFFVEQVVKSFTENSSKELWTLLDEAFAAVNRRTLEGKPYMISRKGRSAQLVAVSFSNAGGHAREPARKRCQVEVETSAMHKHFANLVDEHLTELTKAHLLWTEESVWKPQCRFPAVEEDLLLYLAILGGKSCSSHRNDYYKTYSTKLVFSDVNALPSAKSSNAGENDIKTFENMVAHAIFSSSRRNGVKGIGFSDFLVDLLGEFQDGKWAKTALFVQKADSAREVEPRELFEGYADGVSALLSRTIPFLAPPNAEWPQHILATNQQGCKFGHLVRACGKKRSDVYVQDVESSNEKAILVFDCQYWNQSVDSDTMSKVLKGLDDAWSGWEFVVVFCKELAGDIGMEWLHSALGCAKIKCQQDGKANVEWVFQPEQGARDKLMMVVETAAIGGVVG